MATSKSQIQKDSNGQVIVPFEVLSEIVAGFHPEEIGLVKAWDELYFACQAAEANPELLQAIHDIKESIEDAEAAHAR